MENVNRVVEGGVNSSKLWCHAMTKYPHDRPTVVERNAEISVFDLKDHPDYKFRPSQSVVRVGGFEELPKEPGAGVQAVGQIFGLDPNGHLVVKWTDGFISQCFPQEVFIVSEEVDESDNESWDSESDYDSDASGDTWETESESEFIGEDGARGDAGDGDQLQADAIAEQKEELNLLLGRAKTALSRLQNLLNNFDVTVSAPDCFTDIIRIYRSCHDLDKILQSSFFNDPELTTLISQAKQELSRGRVNRISQNLAQMFEQWSRSLPTDSASAMAKEGSNIGTVSVGGRTIKIGTVKNGKIVEVNMQVAAEEDMGQKQNMPIAETESGCAAADGVGAGQNGSDTMQQASPSGESSEVKSIKKESSEPSISKLGSSCQENRERRPSDPVNDYSGALARRDEANLAGENCVSKAPKRTKADSHDDSGREVKKSRDEGKNSNQVAQELCFKICQNLQKQVVKILEEVNKRAGRLISASGNSSEKSSESASSMNSKEDGDNDTQSFSVEETSATKANVSQQLEDSQLASSVDDGAPKSYITNLSQSTGGVGNAGVGDSVPPSIDEAGERVSVARAGGELATLACDEGGDVPKQREATVRTDPGNEASCEESSSRTSIVSEDLHADPGPCKGFEIYGEAVAFHKYVSQESHPAKPSVFRNCIRKELKLFQSSLPDGIFVKGFEDRMDLYSVMILGPEETPYEDALFLFDIMMPNDYPSSPPLLHYYSFCSDRLNPNLYEDGKVCVSLLGTWSGKGSEVWTAKSNLLQVLLSIQGLILVREPYYNEAYYERQRGTQIGHENSRMYNEMAILKTVQSLTRMSQSLPELFKDEIYKYLQAHGPRMIRRLRHWLDMNEQQRKAGQGATDPSAAGFSGNGALKNSPCHLSESPGDVVSVPEEQPQQTSFSDEVSKPPQAGQVHPPNKDTEQELMLGNHDNDREKGHFNGQPFDSSVDKIFDKISQEAPKGVKAETNGIDNSDKDACRSFLLNGFSVSLDTSRNTEMGTSVDTVPSHLPKSSSEDQASSSSSRSPSADPLKQPEFPLLPMSRGFCLTLQKHLALYEKALQLMVDPAKATPPAASELAQEKNIVVPDPPPVAEEGSDIF
ncbi:ubiquitin-conjugating enzyme E2 O [Elysia marginata]|uniref:Ubiquitin-conjugating enzyme E2 O n=1 Tax=Elysia marginata TaxID=1093978 RepID=A0AAV4GBX4_9GAST|nr:ubiquitin-conjugating enzyme E2 O [Elysia marginata]